MKKICRKCNVEKDLELFGSCKTTKDKKRPDCKACVTAYNKAYRKKNANKLSAQGKVWREANKERKAAMDKAYVEANKEKVAARKKAWVKAQGPNYNKANYWKDVEKSRAQGRASHAKHAEKRNAERRLRYAEDEAFREERKAAQKERKAKMTPEQKLIEGRIYREKNKDELRVKKKEYRTNNKDKVNKYFRGYNKERKETDPNFKLTKHLRTRLYKALVAQHAVKSAKTLELLGASVAFVKKYLESKFTPGMSWDNYGEWHVDHIKPCASFDLTDPEQQRECFNYKNLQPLWWEDNISKGDRYNPD